MDEAHYQEGNHSVALVVMALDTDEERCVPMGIDSIRTSVVAQSVTHVAFQYVAFVQVEMKSVVELEHVAWKEMEQDAFEPAVLELIGLEQLLFAEAALE